MKEKESARVKRTREAIREALMKLADEKDPSRITVTDIAARAGINRKTFYVYYDSVPDLLKKLSGELLQNYLPLLESVDLTGMFFDTQGFVEAFSGIVSHDMDMYHFYSRSGMLAVLLEDVKREFVRIFMEQFGVEDREMNSRLMMFAEYAGAGILAAIHRWIAEKDMSLEDFSDQLARMTLAAIRSIGAQVPLGK